jgi:hypothetical protein
MRAHAIEATHPGEIVTEANPRRLRILLFIASTAKAFCRWPDDLGAEDNATLIELSAGGWLESQISAGFATRI